MRNTILATSSSVYGRWPFPARAYESERARSQGRGFGASEGNPRQVIDVERQRQDFRRAVEHARALDEVDAGTIALWGSSLSCSHVLDLAAADRAIAAVIAMVPFLDAVAGQGSERAPLGVTARLLAAALGDVVHGAFGLPPVLVPVVGAPGEFATMTEPDATAVVAELAAEGSRWVNAIAPRVAFGMPRYRKGTVERIDAPILFCIARHDQSASPSYAVSIARRARAARVVEYDVGHFGMYVGAHRERTIGDQVAFLRDVFGQPTLPPLPSSRPDHLRLDRPDHGGPRIRACQPGQSAKRRAKPG